ncbi:MAG TPA: hypothetical protein VIU62_22585 [Chloroflexota bacterium]
MSTILANGSPDFGERKLTRLAMPLFINSSAYCQEPTMSSFGAHRQLVSAARVRHFGEHSENPARQEGHGIGNVLKRWQVTLSLTRALHALSHQDAGDVCADLRWSVS